MGLFDSLFGSKPKAETTQQPVMTPEQSALLAELIKAFEGKPKAPSEAFTPYEGQLSAGTSNLQNASLAAIEEAVMQQATGGSGNEKAKQTYSNMIDSGGMPVNFDEAFTKGVRDPLLYDFENQVIPRIQSTFAGNAAFGSDKGKARELMVKNLMDTLAGERAKMQYQTSTDALGRVMQSAAGLSGVDSAQIANLVTALNAGSVPQTTEQNTLDRQYQEFLRREAAKTGDISTMLQALGLRQFENVTTVTPGSQGLLGGFAQGLGQNASVGKAITSFFGF